LLVFVEELDVPLPFAPGDVVLIACGLTAAADHLNAPITLLALNASVVARALVGREFFARAGAPIAQRLADLLRIRAAFNRLVGALSRMGWLGVLVGRFTPGPRVHTTEAAGVIGMSRTTFTGGLDLEEGEHSLRVRVRRSKTGQEAKGITRASRGGHTPRPARCGHSVPGWNRAESPRVRSSGQSTDTGISAQAGWAIGRPLKSEAPAKRAGLDADHYARQSLR